jgi:hypothetical protein
MVRLGALLLALSLVHSAQAQTVQPLPAAKAKPAAKKPAAPKAVAETSAASGPCIGVFPLLGDAWWPEPPEAANTPAMRAATRKLLGEVLDKSLPELLAQ